MMMLAVTLHNIPEGMAVGVVLCRLSFRKYANYCGKRIGTVPRHCHSEFFPKI